MLFMTAGDSQHPLVKQWKDSTNHTDLLTEINPMLSKAINQPEALTSQYATSLFTQV